MGSANISSPPPPPPPSITTTSSRSSSSSSSSRRKSKGRTFQCSGYPDCNMTFTRSEHLARHIRKHTGERPFECNHCSRKFSRLDNLRQHKQTVHAHDQHNVQYKDVYDSHQNSEDGETQNEINTLDSISKEAQNTKPDGNNTNNTLLRPTGFKSKHRPRPLVLPTRKPTYLDSPYTVPTPKSASSSHFTLSPISPNHYQFHHKQQQQQPQTANLPPFQNLAHVPISDSFSRDSLYGNRYQGGPTDSLISPYNSSFSSSIHSNSNTPLNSSFDLRTPTNTSFNYSDYNNSNNNNNNNNSNSSSKNNDYSKKQWRNNIMFGSNGQQEYSSPQHSSRTSIQISQNIGTVNMADENRKLKIESLLNDNNNNNNHSNAHLVSSRNVATTTTTTTTTTNDVEHVRLPPVGTLGIR